MLTDHSCYSDEEIKTLVLHHYSTQTALLIMKNIFDTEALLKNLSDYLNISKMYFEVENCLKFLQSVITYLLDLENFFYVMLGIGYISIAGLAFF